VRVPLQIMMFLFVSQHLMRRITLWINLSN
jgi:hypothetical protein